MESSLTWRIFICRDIPRHILGLEKVGITSREEGKDALGNASAVLNLFFPFRACEAVAVGGLPSSCPHPKDDACRNDECRAR